MSALKTLKSQVEYVLDQDPESRNSDIRLMHKIWQKFYPKMLVQFQGKIYICFENMYDVPREDNIKRIRAKFQNELGKYPPTRLEIALKRGIKEDQWRIFMGYAPTPGHYLGAGILK